MYLDYAAATPLDPRVLESMMPFLTDHYGNPSSIHAAGREARAAVEQARQNVADFIGCTPKEVVFTSGGTEANNWAIFGLAETYKGRGNHIISTPVEHDSVLEPLKQLEDKGFQITYLQPTKEGVIPPEQLKQAIKPETIFASIIYANNEIGTVQNIPALAKILKEHNIPFHIDACQATNYLPMNRAELGVDLMTINSGKIYGPKGAGALIIRDGINITPLLFGGGQEFRMRSGTENVAAIVGFGTAIQNIPPENERLTALRDTFIRQLLAIPDVTLNGHPTDRLPNNINISIKGVDNESLLVRLDMEGIAASAGSACSSGSIEPSHVLTALRLPEETGKRSIRFSLGRSTTAKELQTVAQKVQTIVNDLRAQ